MQTKDKITLIYMEQQIMHMPLSNNLLFLEFFFIYIKHMVKVQ